MHATGSGFQCASKCSLRRQHTPSSYARRLQGPPLRTLPVHFMPPTCKKPGLLTATWFAMCVTTGPFRGVSLTETLGGLTPMWFALCTDADLERRLGSLNRRDGVLVQCSRAPLNRRTRTQHQHRNRPIADFAATLNPKQNTASSPNRCSTWRVPATQTPKVEYSRMPEAATAAAAAAAKGGIAIGTRSGL